MDREQEQMQFLGFFGIIKESFKIIISCRKIFSQITLILILPQTIIILVDLQNSNFLFKNINYMKFEKAYTTHATKGFSNLSDRLSFEWMTFWLFKLIITLILNLLSTTAVVHTIASVYTGRRELTFKEVMSVVPKVWKRLMLTLLYLYVAFCVYIFFAILVGIICAVTLPNDEFGAFLIGVFIIIFNMGIIYTSVIWQLASVVTVLESSSYGLKAMTKSNDLIKGKRAVAIWITVLLSLLDARILILFELFVVHGSSLAAWKRVGFGVMCSLLLLSFSLLELVIKTVLYLVCKSYHHESIDEDDLYEPLNGEDIPL